MNIPAFALPSLLPTAKVSTPLPMTDTLRHRRLPPVRPHRPVKVLSMGLQHADAHPDGSAGNPWRLRLPSGLPLVLLVIAAHLLVATFFLSFAEGWALLDALYFAVVVATTIGYGDLAPTRPLSKVFVSCYAVLSVAIIANMLQTLVERLANMQTSLGAVSTIPTFVRRLFPQPRVLKSDDFSEGADVDVDHARLNLRATVLVFMSACLSGALLYRRFLRISLLDLFYFTCVSMTTVGLGDIHPVTPAGKAYAIIWLVLTSLGFANILSQYARLRFVLRQRDIARIVMSARGGERMFAEIDNDDDGTLSEAEYLGYVLSKLGKVTPQDVRRILSRFRQLDLDHSGVITKQELESSANKLL